VERVCTQLSLGAPGQNSGISNTSGTWRRTLRYGLEAGAPPGRNHPSAAQYYLRPRAPRHRRRCGATAQVQTAAAGFCGLGAWEHSFRAIFQRSRAAERIRWWPFVCGGDRDWYRSDQLCARSGSDGSFAAQGERNRRSGSWVGPNGTVGPQVSLGGERWSGCDSGISVTLRGGRWGQHSLGIGRHRTCPIFVGSGSGRCHHGYFWRKSTGEGCLGRRRSARGA